MDEHDRTHAQRPSPKRPKYGWLAWEATVGYISQQYNPDATLKLQIYPTEHIISWNGSLSWGQENEEVTNRVSLADALSSLWKQVESRHDLLKTFEAVTRKPAKYADEEWLDEATYDALSRLVHVTDTVFSGDWQVLILYRPIEVPEKRLQARLLADKKQVSRGGQGTTLKDACRDVYMKTAAVYQEYSIRKNQS